MTFKKVILWEIQPKNIFIQFRGKYALHYCSLFGEFRPSPYAVLGFTTPC